MRERERERERERKNNKIETIQDNKYSKTLNPNCIIIILNI
jgi:hypothetical protein